MREKHIPPYAVRVYYRHLFELVEHERDVATRVMAGSVPPGNEELWAYAREGGYETDLLRRVEIDDGSWREQGVDELLHLKIANVLLDYAPPQSLVLVTGDGRSSTFGTSFPHQAERALRRAWAVEIWSWRQALSPAYAELSTRYPGLSIRELDRYYKEITFIKAGTYRRADGKQINVAGRRVNALST